MKCGEGALVVDVRTDQQFDEAHIPGAVCITALSAGFGSRLAWIADRAQEIVLVGPRRRRCAARGQARDRGRDPAAGGVPARRDDELA